MSLNKEQIRVISFDLDDTLWPILPVIQRAERALSDWLKRHAPRTAALYADTVAMQELRTNSRMQLLQQRPDLAHDLSAIRKESIRMNLQRAGENPKLADEAFDVFFEERNRVEYYEDAIPCVNALAKHYPMVTISNGNAQLERVGLSRFFSAAVSASNVGIGKPDPKIFQAAAQAAGVLPHQVLHIGDDATLDVKGALDAGMQAIWLNRQGKTWKLDGVRPTLEISSLTQLRWLLLNTENNNFVDISEPTPLP